MITTSPSNKNIDHHDFTSMATFLKASREYLSQSLSQQQADISSSSSSCSSSSPTLPHFVLGNPAGDADSIVSAIGLAYVDTIMVQQQQQQQQLQFTDNDDNNNSNNSNNNSSPSMIVVPIMSISISDLKTQRPETTYLLKDCAGMTDLDLDQLIGMDELRTMDNSHLIVTHNTTVTLVDHNHHHHHHHTENIDNNNSDIDTHTHIDTTVADVSGWRVIEIVDHHKDEGHHYDTCIVRNIAFEESQPLVASTCTLIVERFYQRAKRHKLQWPPTLSILLLGVILLDSVNMLPGKGTPRDGVALERLLEDTDWTQLTLPEEITTDTTTGKPDPTKLFETLQAQKFSKTFWAGLTALQAIRMDYKAFPLSVPSKKSSSDGYLGIATILQDMDTFWTKDNVVQSMVQVIEEDNLQVLALMHTFLQDTVHDDGKDDDDDDKSNTTTTTTKTTQTKGGRQLVLASLDKDRLVHLLHYLTETVAVSTLDTVVVDLELTGYEHVSEEEQVSSSDLPAVYYVKMNQGNVKASRKQVAPILTSFWNRNDDT
ncbi:DHHA2 domain containing protein [Nitzschia inconspicua]|uniref:DHHA2 domain containing protein n=1 Tax=Nitzschia inconspicua TaxID=303405 RepID=A0A9K3KF54_9STRA|nr:DHHA2 domain containing protein [Nitzschia inconspicua]